MSPVGCWFIFKIEQATLVLVHSLGHVPQALWKTPYDPLQQEFRIEVEAHLGVSAIAQARGSPGTRASHPGAAGDFGL